MGQRPDKTGRNQNEHFAMMFRDVMSCPARAALSTTAQAIYPWLKLEWHGPKANNNGRIRLSVRQASVKVGVGINAAARAMQDLQAKGFIYVTEMGALGVEGEARGPSYEITELALPGPKIPAGRRLFMQWRKGADLPIAKHNTNNPKGRNGRKTPSSKQGQSNHQNGDVVAIPVINLNTPRLRTGDVQGKTEVLSVPKRKTSLVAIYSGGKPIPDLSALAGLDLCPLWHDRRTG